MKVYMVENGDHVLMGLFRKKREASQFAYQIGKRRWNETWTVMEVPVGSAVDITLLLGCEEFRATKHGQRVAREIVGTHT